MPGLKGRISRLKSLGLVKASELEAGSSEAPAPAAGPRRGKTSPPERGHFLPGWERAAPHVYLRTAAANFSLGESQVPIFHPEHFERHSSTADRSAPPAPSTGLPLDGLSFFDLETTGLSGGTGTIAFLAAIGYFEGGDFLVTQVFVDDFPGEASFLESVIGILARRPHVVTYNGAAFDLPLLRTRCIMNAVPVPELEHIDVLKTARRFWRKTLGSCALQAMESSVLGEQRVGDIPGSMIPAIWLEYSAGGAGARSPETIEAMGKIAEHNALDVVSLARLFLRVERIMAEPERRWAADRVHAPRLAAELMAMGREAEGFSILEACGAEGDQTALLLLARLRRRRRELDAYERAVLAMEADSLMGLLERAKLFEHIKRDYMAALSCAERAAELLNEAPGEIAELKLSRRGEALEALARRKERLRRKLARSATE